MPPKKAKKVVGYQKAEPIAPGFVVTDARKVSYVTGEAVGEGGFGLIYLADVQGRKIDIDNARYVMKIEPKANGPLFQEINFYNRHCKESDILKFAKEKKLEVLGIPKFMSSGVIAYNGNDLRYLVMQRFGRDLQKVFDENGTFSRKLNAQIATKMLFSLEYMHRKRYAHADIKGANILLGNEVTHDKEEVYLIDFGLAYLLPANPVEKPDPKAKHDGTIEYCSTDAHAGCKPSFRGDLEILLWNLAHWASGELPWLQYVKEGMPDSQKEKVAELKRKNLKSSGEFLEELGLGDHKELVLLMKYLRGMKYGDEIDFNKVRSFFAPQLPSGKSLAFTKIRSRKSFVPGKKLPKVKRNTAADPELTPAPAKKAAATKPRATPIASKSAAEKVKVLGRQGRSKKPVYDFSSDEDMEEEPVAPSSTRSRRRQKSEEQEDDDFSLSRSSTKKSQKTAASTSRARVSKRAKPKTSTEEDSVEISVPTKQPAKKQARSTDSPSVRSSTRASARKIPKAQAETIAETSEEDIPKATPKARSVKSRTTRKKVAKQESTIATSEEELFKEPQMIKNKDDNRSSAYQEENQENIPPESEDEITFKIQSKKSLKLNLSVDAETSTELFDDSTELDFSTADTPVNRTNRDESMSVSGDDSHNIAIYQAFFKKSIAEMRQLPDIKVVLWDLEDDNVKVNFDGGPTGDQPRPVVYKNGDPSLPEDKLVEDTSKEPPKLAPNKNYIGELDFEEINRKTRESRRKRMPQPGKNLCPRDQSMQTIASWLQERPEKVQKLRAQLAEEKPFFAAIPKKCL